MSSLSAAPSSCSGNGFKEALGLVIPQEIINSKFKKLFIVKKGTRTRVTILKKRQITRT